jgi:hypothetical protein
MCNIEILLKKWFGNISHYEFLATLLAAYLATWQPPWWSGLVAPLLTATAAASCRSGTKNYTANFGYLKSLPSKFQVSRLEIAACSMEHTNKEHFELKVKSHYVPQIFCFYHSFLTGVHFQHVNEQKLL